jgi:hypothetical protein
MSKRRTGARIMAATLITTGLVMMKLTNAH